jgi:hypothetical protein
VQTGVLCSGSKAWTGEARTRGGGGTQPIKTFQALRLAVKDWVGRLLQVAGCRVDRDAVLRALTFDRCSAGGVGVSHPAAQTFHVLCIAVSDEPDGLATGGLVRC